MPKEGFSSLTIREVTYSNFLEIYNKHRKPLRLLGINSFSGFITTFLHELIGNKKTFNLVVGQMAKRHQDAIMELKL